VTLSAVYPQNNAAYDQPKKAAESKSNEVATAKDVEGRLATYTLWLAVFTAVLAVSTIGLWVVTWRSGSRQERMSRTHERAYISGGGPFPAPGKPPGYGTVTIENYGRTPAVIKTVEWGVCPETIFPTKMKVSEILDRNLLPAGIINIYKIEGIYPANMPPRVLTPHIAFDVSKHQGHIFLEGTSTRMFSTNRISAHSN
jgi:hypothetical protein